MKKEIIIDVGSRIDHMRFDPENQEGFKMISSELDFILHNKIRLLPIYYRIFKQKVKNGYN